MKELEGSLINLGDAYEASLDRIGEGGFAEGLASASNDLAAFLNENQAAAERLGGMLGSAVESGAGGLLALADNADLAAVALASVFAGRAGGAASAYAAATAKNARETRALAVEAQRAAKAEAIRTRQAYAAARAQNLVGISLKASARAAMQAQVQLAAANAQLRAVSVSAIAASRAMTALRGTMAFFGGPVGLAITGVAVGLGYWATRTDDATLAMQTHERILEDVRSAYEQAGSAADEWADAVKAATVTETIANLERMQAQLQEIRDMARAPVDAFGTDTEGVTVALARAVDAFKEGELSARDFRQEVDRIAQAHPQLNRTIAEDLLKVARNAEEAEGRVASMSAVLNIVQDRATEADYALLGLADAASRARDELAASGDAAAKAANQYAAALSTLSAAIPAMADAARVREKLAEAETAYQAAVKGADALPDGNARNTALDEAANLYSRATDEVTGLAKATADLERSENRVYLQGLPDKQRALAEVRQRFDQQRTAIQEAIDAGGDAQKGAAALARVEAALSTELAQTSKRFDEQATSAGGAADSLDQYRQLVQSAAEQEFPWLQAAREADELRAALKRLEAAGEALPEEYTVAIKARLDDLDAEAADRTGKQVGEDFAAAFQSGIGDLFKDLFDGGLEDFDDFLDKLTSTFAGLASQNIGALFSGDAFKGLGEDGAGTKADPVAEVRNAVQAGTERGASVGTIKGFSAAFGGQGGAVGAAGLIGGTALGSFSLGYQSQSPLMGGLGGALSGLSGGLQLASALGLAAGPLGIIGAVAGGGLGLLGGILGKNNQLKQKRQQAQKQLVGELGAIDQFKQVSYGRGIGDFRGDFTDYSDQSQKYQILARDAGNFGLQRELEEAHSQYFALLELTFRKERDVALENLNLGFGFDTAFFQAVDSMEQARDRLTGWVDDARYMFDRLRDFGHDLNQDEVNTYISEMEHAAQRYAISLVTGVEPMSDIAERLNEIKGAAVGLEETLVRLAMSSEDAAKAVDDALAVALEKLKDDYANELGRSINALNDKGYVNDLADAVERLETRLADAALLGVSGAQALEEFDLTIAQITKSAADALPAADRFGVFQAAIGEVARAGIEAEGVLGGLLVNALTDLQKGAAAAAGALAEGAASLYSSMRGSLSGTMGIGFFGEIETALSTYRNRLSVAEDLGIEATGAFSELEWQLKSIAANSNLTGAQLSALAEVFPSLSNQLMGLVGTGGSASVADAQAARDQAEAALRAAYQRQRSDIEATVSALESFIDQIGAFRDSLKTDSSLSPLSPIDQLTEAARIYNETLDSVANGDQDALGRLEQVSRDYLTEARSYYGSSEGYFQIFESVDQALADSLAAADREMSVADQQLAALDEQVGALIDINDGVLTVADGIAGLETAMGALASAQAAQVQAIYALGDIRASQDAEAIQSLYQNLLGRAADPTGLAGWQDVLAQGGSLQDVAHGISGSTEAHIRSLYKSILGREADAAGLSHWGDFLSGGGTLQGVASGILNSQEARLLGIPGMAAGGLVTGGVSGVDSVPRMLMPGEFVVPALQTRRYMPELQAMQAGTFGGYANDNNGALIAEVRALRQEVARLSSVTAAGAQAQIAATGDVAGAVRDQGRAQDLIRRRVS